MSRLEMEHKSYPGFYGTSLSSDAAESLSAVAEVMIPAADGFPASGRIVAAFVSERIDPVERDGLERLLATVGELSPSGLTAWLERVEVDDPTNFLLLRNWVYFGYYSSGSVAEALRLGGSDYHGAPQPFGYQIEQDAPVPSTPRGSYQKTEEVRRVLD